MGEREIDLLDLLLNILLHWRGMAVLMLVGGILLGSYSYVKSDKDAKALQAQYDAQSALLENVEDEEDVLALGQSILEEKMTATQIANVLSVIANEELLSEKREYIDNSVLMQTDANRVPEEQIVFAVLADDMETANSIALLYENILTGNGLGEYLADKFDLEQAVADELYSVRYGTDKFYNGNNSFSISVIYSDKDTCEEIAGAVTDYADLQYDLIKQYMGEHELVVLGKYYSETTNIGLLNTKKTYVSDVITLETSIAKAKDAFSDEEVAYYNSLTNSKMDINEDEDEAAKEENTIELPAIVPAHVSAKYVLSGAVLFAFLYACLIAAAYIFDNRIKLCDNIQTLYNIPQLGRVEQKHEKKGKPLQFVDDWLIALWSRNKRSFSEEESVDLATVAVKIAARKNDADSVSLIGCNMKKGSLKVCEQIKANLQKDGITVNILDNVIYDAEAMEKLDNASAAVLVENVSSTLYGEIAEEIALLKRQNIKALGGIIVSAR